MTQSQTHTLRESKLTHHNRVDQWEGRWTPSGMHVEKLVFLTGAYGALCGGLRVGPAQFCLSGVNAFFRIQTSLL